MEIDGIGPALPAPLARPASPAGPAASFRDALETALREVHEPALRDAEIQSVAAGEPIAVRQVTVSAEEAAVAFDLLVEIRNRLLEAYGEIQRMQA
jgi:flagellar hook-basal body complex protein FliE